jgi:hypothetical protein
VPPPPKKKSKGLQPSEPYPPVLVLARWPLGGGDLLRLSGPLAPALRAPGLISVKRCTSMLGETRSEPPSVAAAVLGASEEDAVR